MYGKQKPDQYNTSDPDAQFKTIQQNQAVLSEIYKLSEILNTGLSQETLNICVKLCEAGVHPYALAECISQITAQTKTINNNQNHK